MKNAHELVEQARHHIQEIPLADAEAAIQAADVLIDVREADEYREGHINGALNIPRGVLEFKLSATPELAARDMNMYLDDFECCKAACGEAC